MQNRTYDLEALVCVYVGGGGGGGGGYYSPLSFIYRSPRGEEDYVALRPCRLYPPSPRVFLCIRNSYSMVPRELAMAVKSPEPEGKGFSQP